MGASRSEPPLSTLLSQALVAFTIELDNEFEHRMPHRTTRSESGSDTPFRSKSGSDAPIRSGSGREARQGPWLVSLAMYLNCMRWLGEDGLTVAELERVSRTTTNLDGMRRWRYVTIDPEPGPGASRQPRRDARLRPTRHGRAAQEVWRPLLGEIEQRWGDRFGGAELDQLTGALRAIVGETDLVLPDCMPILRHGLWSAQSVRRGPTQDAGELTLASLLARALLAFTAAYERRSELSLAVGSDVLRVLDDDAVRVRDLPARSGVSKEAIAMATGFLQRQRHVTVEPIPAPARGKRIRLTASGRAAQRRHDVLTEAIEAGLRERFGAEPMKAVRASLTKIVGDGTRSGSPLFDGLAPYPDGWRSSVRQPDLLPHFPVVLHRGGFPDGS
jgi:DNA-binding MarR family transcriptional regulator